jgi:hypothetical protein
MSWKAPLILILAGIMISASVILYTEIVGQERRDPYQEDRGVRTLPKQQQPQYYQPPPPRHDGHSDESITEQIATIFLDQGWIGAMMLLLMAYMHYSQKTARADRIRLEESLVQIMMDNNKELAKFSAELDNLSREVERIRG